MSLTIYTARLPRDGRRGYAGPDALDITRRAAEEARDRGEVSPGEPFAPSRELLDWGLRECRAGRRAASWPSYALRYREEMRASFTRERAAWDEILRLGSLTLCCLCETVEMCHRSVLAELLLAAAVRARMPAVRGGERVVALRALTLHQPWATYVAIGAKTVETRSWGTGYRGDVAIHASKTTTSLDGLEALTLKQAGLEGLVGRLPEVPADGDGLGFPLGCVVAVATLCDCFQVGQCCPAPDGQRFVARRDRPDGTDGVKVPSADFVLGDLSPGRFGWRLERVRALPSPVPARGFQGLWELEESIERAVLAQLEPASATAGGSH